MEPDRGTSRQSGVNKYIREMNLVSSIARGDTLLTITTRPVNQSYVLIRLKMKNGPWLSRVPEKNR